MKKLVFVTILTGILLFVNSNVLSYEYQYSGKYQIIESAYLNGMIAAIKLTMSKDTIQIQKERLKKLVKKSVREYMEDVVNMTRDRYDYQ
jgi:hypothetical protein